MGIQAIVIMYLTNSRIATNHKVMNPVRSRDRG